MKQNGNVLFLVLLAVALFAALSYAVTKSTSGGGAGIDREKISLNVSYYQQYLTSIKVAIDRMTIRGVSANDVVFYATPGDTTSGSCTSGETCVFSADGGGAEFLSSFPGKTANTMGFQNNAGLASIGTAGGKDLYVTAYGVTAEECEYINAQLGLPAVGVGIDASGILPGEPLQCQLGAFGPAFFMVFATQ